MAINHDIYLKLLADVDLSLYIIRVREKYDLSITEFFELATCLSGVIRGITGFAGNEKTKRVMVEQFGCISEDLTSYEGYTDGYAIYHPTGIEEVQDE